MTQSYRVTFDRIGRGNHGHVETVECDEDELPERIYRIVAPKLASRFPEVDVYEEDGVIHASIGMGRHGHAIVTPTTATQEELPDGT